MLNLGRSSTARGQTSLRLLQVVQDAIGRGKLRVTWLQDAFAAYDEPSATGEESLVSAPAADIPLE